VVQDHFPNPHGNRSAEGKDFSDCSKIEAEGGTTRTLSKEPSVDSGNPASSNGASDKKANTSAEPSLINARSTSGGSTPAKAGKSEPEAKSVRSGKE
jgi:hypothetical protein